MKRRTIITGCVILLLGLCLAPVLAYSLANFGFCQGWWLRSNLWIYQAWVCDCGPDLETNLYPKQFDLVLSACEIGGKTNTSLPQVIAISLLYLLP